VEQVIGLGEAELEVLHDSSAVLIVALANVFQQGSLLWRGEGERECIEAVRWGIIQPALKC
jgi:hypothetical protein